MKSLTNLLKKYLKIYNSNRNTENKKYFEKTMLVIMHRTRFVPKNLDKIDNNIPFVYWLDEGMWYHMFNINLERLYKEPLYYLENWLKARIFYYENFSDCTYVDNCIPIWLGLGFEATLFGCKTKYSKYEEPTIDFNDIIIKDHKDLKKLKVPDFYSSDRMKLAFKFYNEINKVVSGHGIKVGFFDWMLSPLFLSNYLRGLLNLSIDFMTNREFVRNLMDFVVTSRINWSKKRDEFLGIERKNGMMLNDSLSTPNISPNIYNELIFPYEQEINNFYGGISYYHSCGPLDPFLNKIKDLGNIELMHSGPFTDYKKVFKVFHNKSPIELYLPKRKHWEKEDLKKELIEIKESSLKFGVRSFYIRYTSFYDPDISISNKINKHREICNISREILINS